MDKRKTIEEKKAPDLAQRRDPRYECDLNVTLMPKSFFSPTCSARLCSWQERGVGLFSVVRQKVGSTAQLSVIKESNEKALTLRVRCLWSKFDVAENLFVSGWKFEERPGSYIEALNTALLPISKLIDTDRREQTHVSAAASKDIERPARISEAVNSFELLHPQTEFLWRRSRPDRRAGKRDEQSGSSKKSPLEADRRAIDRRVSSPSNPEADQKSSHHLEKILQGVRDFFYYWLPAGLVSRFAGSDHTFAFVTHPRTYADVQLQYRFARFIPEKLIDWWLKWQWPVIGAEIGGISRLDGKISKGWLIFCPLTAKQMIRDRELAKKKVIDAVHFAKKVGARVVGLGAFTSIVTRDGVDVAEDVPIGITTGNALSAAVAVQNVVIALNISKQPLEEITIAIVGAAGNVGAACARSFYGHVKKMILVDVNPRTLSRLVGELQGKSTEIISSSAVESILPADVVIAVTNAPGAVVRSAHLKKGAIVVDCAQPKNVSENVPNERPDTVVIESAVVRFPKIDCVFNLGINDREALGCMGETIVLDAIGWHKNYSIGQLSSKQASDILAAAKAIGVEVAPFRNSKGYVAEKEFRNRTYES